MKPQYEQNKLYNPRYSVFDYGIINTKTFEDLPQRQLQAMVTKLYLLCFLGWDYTFTVLDIAVQRRIHQTKPLCRAVRKLKHDYDRQRALNAEDTEIEMVLAEMFEDGAREHLNKLSYGLQNEIAAYGLDDENMYLVQAVQMAMTVVDAVRMYARECDTWIREQGVKTRHSILSDHFTALGRLLPEFAGDCYDRHSETRYITAMIILNEIKKLEINEGTSDN